MQPFNPVSQTALPNSLADPGLSPPVVLDAADSGSSEGGEWVNPLRPILDHYREPLFVIDRNRRVLFRNAAAVRVLRSRSGFAEKKNGGPLSLGSARADAALQGAIGNSLQPGRSNPIACRGVRVARPGGSGEWLVLVHPWHQLLGDASTPTFLVQVVGRTRPRAAPLAVLRDLFDLTTREMTVVSELLRTGTAHKAALRLKLSHETIRSHLKRIFRKCDLHSQTELMSLIHCISQFDGVV